MPTDDYTPVVRGGLKLKGSGITKKKKKTQNPKPEESSKKNDALLAATAEDADPNTTTLAQKKKSRTAQAEDVDEKDEEPDLRELEQPDSSGKTPTERAYEENRRKRLQARLDREGPKTHKQRVEDLNKYLSTLSEHHDMPRIGPG